MDKFWEEAHVGDKQYELTGAKPDAILKFLKLNKETIANAKSCLVIGVGFGHETRYLADLGMKVSVLDISKKALERVRDITVNQYLPSQLESIPDNSFDLIISHLVTQHMSNEGLEEQVQNCIRSLKPEGIFAMQFASKRKDVAYSTKVTVQKQKDGLMSRSMPYMKNLVRESDGKVTWRSVPMYLPHLNHSWIGVHLKKAEATNENVSLLGQVWWFLDFSAYSVGLIFRRLFSTKKA